jgi:hypothetical protein
MRLSITSDENGCWYVVSDEGDLVDGPYTSEADAHQAMMDVEDDETDRVEKLIDL